MAGNEDAKYRGIHPNWFLPDLGIKRRIARTVPQIEMLPPSVLDASVPYGLIADPNVRTLLYKYDASILSRDIVPHLGKGETLAHLRQVFPVTDEYLLGSLFENMLREGVIKLDPAINSSKKRRLTPAQVRGLVVLGGYIPNFTRENGSVAWQQLAETGRAAVEYDPILNQVIGSPKQPSEVFYRSARY